MPKENEIPKEKKEEEKYNAMSVEEKKEVDDHKKADEIKAKGMKNLNIINKQLIYIPKKWYII